jgi:hypothetical protein
MGAVERVCALGSRGPIFPTYIMSVRKLVIDAKAYFRKCLANGDAGALGYDPQYGGEIVTGWRSVCEDLEFWKNADRDPQLLRFYHGGSTDNWAWNRLYIFQNCVYGIRGAFTPEQDNLLIQEHLDSERRKFERLTHRLELAQHTEPRTERTGIPEAVRVAVWRRDSGRCVKCGSRERLEYDHIVPVSRGGSSTVRNVELLCEKCNRSKGPIIQ